MAVCLSLCLFARLLKKLLKDFDEIFGGIWHGARTSRLDFGADLDPDPDTGFLNRDRGLDLGFCKVFLLTYY